MGPRKGHLSFLSNLGLLTKRGLPSQQASFRTTGIAILFHGQSHRFPVGTVPFVLLRGGGVVLLEKYAPINFREGAMILRAKVYGGFGISTLIRATFLFKLLLLASLFLQWQGRQCHFQLKKYNSIQRILGFVSVWINHFYF